ncbi:MAG: HAD family hydrolase [Anaerolineales bacterium]|jgi:putative hydrolase of the HAD superfamily
MLDWIAFDADDTLWKNEEYYLQGRAEFLEILMEYGLEADDIHKFDRFEVENIRYFGYGVMSFILSMIEIAIKLTNETIHPRDIQRIIQLGKEMLTHEVEVYPGVRELLDELVGKIPLMLITKGDLQHQRNKVRDSGLGGYFQVLEVVSDKNPRVYQEVLERHQVQPARFLMIGNSLRSDVLPVLELGCWGLHLADHPTWSHEDDQLAEGAFPRYLEAAEITDVLGVLESRGLLGDSSS